MINVQDLLLTDDFDFVVQDGDFVLAPPEAALKQNMTLRALANKGDYKFYPTLGSNLESLMGKHNSAETGMEGVELLTQAMSFDNLVNPSDLRIEPVPLTPNTLAFYLLTSVSDLFENTVTVVAVVDLNTGISFKPVGEDVV